MLLPYDQPYSSQVGGLLESLFRALNIAIKEELTHVRSTIPDTLFPCLHRWSTDIDLWQTFNLSSLFHLPTQRVEVVIPGVIILGIDCEKRCSTVT